MDVSYIEDFVCFVGKDNFGKGLGVERNFFIDDGRCGVCLWGVCCYGRSGYG